MNGTTTGGGLRQQWLRVWVLSLGLGLAACGGGGDDGGSDGPAPTPILQPEVLRGSVVNFVAQQEGETVTGNTTEPVDSLAGARFTVTVLNSPDEAGNFGEVIDITEAVRIEGEGLEQGEFEIDADMALAAVNVDPRLALQSFISSQIALNVELDDAPAVGQAAAEEKVRAKALFPFASTLIDVPGGSSSALQLSRASNFVVERFQARIRSVALSGSGVQTFLNGINPLDLRAPRVQLEMQIAATPIQFNNADAGIFAEQLANNGLASQVEADIDVAVAVNEPSARQQVVGNYNFLSYEVLFFQFAPNGPFTFNETGTLNFGFSFTVSEQANELGTGLQLQSGRDLDTDYLQSRDSGGNYGIFKAVDFPSAAEADTFNVPVSLSSDSSFVANFPLSAARVFDNDGNEVEERDEAFAFRFPPTPTALRTVTLSFNSSRICLQANCVDGSGAEIGVEGDVIARDVSNAFGFVARHHTAPLAPSAINGAYGLFLFSFEADPVQTRVVETGDGRLSFTNGVGNLSAFDVTTVERTVSAAPAASIAVTDVAESLSINLTVSTPNHPVFGNGRLAVRLTEANQNPSILLGFADTPQVNSFFVSNAFECENTTANTFDLCPEGRFETGDTPLRPTSDSGHFLLSGLKLPSTPPSAAALVGRYRPQGFLFNHYTDGSTSHFLFVDDSVLDLRAGGGAVLRANFSEVVRDSDAGPVRVGSQEEAGSFFGTYSVDGAGRLTVLLDEPESGVTIRLRGYLGADDQTLMLSFAVGGVAEPVVDQGGLGMIIGHRLP